MKRGSQEALAWDTTPRWSGRNLSSFAWPRQRVEVGEPTRWLGTYHQEITTGLKTTEQMSTKALLNLVKVSFFVFVCMQDSK